MSDPTLSIIIPNFNTKNLLKDCLTSIYQDNSGNFFEIIVVDNASQDRSLSMLKKNFSKVISIRNKTNLGYGRACNQGIKKAKGKYILLLNSDTLVPQDTLKKALSWIKKHPQVDIVGCKLLNIDKSLQPSAGYFPTLLRLALMMLFIDDIPIIKTFTKSYQIRNNNFYEHEQEVDWVTGAFLLAPRQAMLRLNGFDQSIFMYAEEVDLCFRAKNKNMKVYYTPSFSIIHYKGKSSIDGFKAAILGEYKGILAFFKKYKSLSQTKVLKLILKTGALIRMLIFFVIMDNTRRRIYEEAYKLV